MTADNFAADDRSTELLNTENEPVDDTTPGTDHTLYLDRDDTIEGTPEKYSAVEITTEDGETHRGVCTSFGRVSGPTGGFYQHEVSAYVPEFGGTVWVHTGRDDSTEVEIDGEAEAADNPWGEGLGYVDTVDFTVSAEDDEPAAARGDRVLVRMRGPKSVSTKRTGEITEVRGGRPGDTGPVYVVDLDAAGEAHVTADAFLHVEEIDL